MSSQRIITAFAMGIPAIAMVFLPTAWLALITGGLMLLCAWEWAALSGWKNRYTQWGYTLLILLVGGGIYFFPADNHWLLIIACLWWVVATLWLIAYQAGKDWPPGSRMTSLMGVLIIPPAWQAMLILHADAAYGPVWLLFLLVMIWMGDTAAYFSGRRWGNAKLAPRVSPGKTWAGVIGGLAGGLVLASGFAWWQDMQTLNMIFFIALCLLTLIMGVVGDLIESLCKRQAGVKDSSQLLPGHGGFLDRLDSFTAAAPIFVMGLYAFKFVPPAV